MDATVLIADGNGARANAIAKACGDRGISCAVAPHGAAALEVALTEVPEILLADPALPLIDLGQLREILRTNPRTEGIRLIRLGSADPGEPAAAQHCFDAAMPPADVADSLWAMLEEDTQRVRMSDGVSGSEGSAGVDGELEQLALTDLLQLFHVSRKTGTVELERRTQGDVVERGKIALSRGEILHAEVGGISGEKALFRLIAWLRGSFAFRPGPVPIESTVKQPTLALLREGRRQVSEWKRLAGRMPPMDAHATLTIRSASLPNVIHPLTQEVLLVLENFSRIGDVVDHCSYPDYQVLRMLHTLIRRGMLALRRDVPGPNGSSPRAGLFSPAQASRLRSWIEQEGPGAPDAKLLVAASSAEAGAEFARVMARLPGVELSPSAAGSPLPADRIGPLGRIAVDGATGIEFIQVPVADRFHPLWPVAGEGAIAVLLILAGPLSAAVEAIREIGEALRRLPRARVFYMMLLEKGRSVAADELGENIALLDETSLFLIPQENDGKAQILLREMFGRIVL